MAINAIPLSRLWRKKQAVDYVRSVVTEYDDQNATDDMIAASIQAQAMFLFKLHPAYRLNYIIPIPLTLDGILTANPADSVSTVKPADINYWMPYKITMGANTPQQLVTPRYPVGHYSHHFETPNNFGIVDWMDLFNTDTGSCRKSSDFSQLMGACMGNSTNITRTVMWYNFGPDLWVSMREGLNPNTIIVPMAVRTMIPLIRLEASAGVPTGIEDDIPTNNPALPDFDERIRYIPVQNDWEYIDIPDQYGPLVFNMAAIKVWGMVEKRAKEDVETSVNAQLAQLDPSVEMAWRQRQEYEKRNQYTDKGHL